MSYGISNLASLTVADGLCNHPCSGTMGDFVWVDLNGNNLQDPGEPGIPNVLLVLKDDQGNVLDYATTDGDGMYAFNGACAGTYTIEIDLSSVPAGYLPVTCELGSDVTVDSNCSPATVVLTADDSIDLDTDFGFTPPVLTPGMELVKTAGAATIAPYEAVTYFYTVTNTGGTTLTNIVVSDDNGTPNFAGDDLTIGTIASLAPGFFETLSAQIIPVVCTGAVVNGNPLTAGAVIVVVTQANGDIKVTYLQDFGINDNTYGTGAIGWSGNNHNFGHLTGSDKLELRFFDANNTKVLDFYLDYLTSSSSFPSGYGALGPFGGDGSLIFGSASDIVSWTTSLSDNLNDPANLPFKSALIVNSPTSLVAGNVVIDPAKAPGGWDAINSYTVVVKGSAFGAAGFGSVVVPDQHNSPNKPGGPNGMTTFPVDCTVVNTAKAVAATADGALTASDTASVDIVVPPTGGGSCNLTITEVKFDKKEVRVKIQNGGSTDAVLNALTFTWPAANGSLNQVKLDGDVAYDNPDIAPPSVNLTSGDFVSNLSKRTIAAGATRTLKLVFVNNVDKNAANYSGGLVTFNADCSLVLP